jgi:hypothetical protein
LRGTPYADNRGRQNHAAWRECEEFAHGILVNSASPFTENSPFNWLRVILGR